jgi:hypothetical protein
MNPHEGRPKDVKTDIKFHCPSCDGPVVTERAHVGLETACPHCLTPLTVPEFPSGHPAHLIPEHIPYVRRILKQIRDREMEGFRQQLQSALWNCAKLEWHLKEAAAANGGRVHELEAKLQARDEELKILKAHAMREVGHSPSRETEQLRKQLASWESRFEQANQAFAASRKQSDALLGRLTEQLRESRENAAALQAEQTRSQSSLEASRSQLAASDLEIERLRLEGDSGEIAALGHRENAQRHPTGGHRGPGEHVEGRVESRSQAA